MSPTEPSLIAVNTAPVDRFVRRVREIWDDGDAVLPLSDGLSGGERRALLGSLRPTAVETRDGMTPLQGGVAASPGTAAVIATSGATGRPKGVELSHAAFDRAASAVHERLEAGADDRWLCCLPVAHIGGFAILARSRSLGTAPVVVERFDPAALGRAEATLVSLVPTMLLRALDAGMDLSRFRAVLIGGAALERSLRRRAEDAGVNVVETYGMTETCGGVVYDGIPLPGVEVALSDEGLVRIRGPMLMSGYRLDPQRSAAALADGWFATSDVGRYEDGRLVIAGRADDAIVTGGHKVIPEEVEAALRDHPGIEDVCAFGVDDEQWGQRVTAAIVARGSTAPSVTELRSYLGPRLAAYKHPREVILVDAIPYLASGKPARRALRDVLTSR